MDKEKELIIKALKKHRNKRKDAAMDLGISERTAVLHVNNAMHKLGCINKHQAVLKALRLGLIH